MTLYIIMVLAMEENVSNYTNAVDSGKQAITQRLNGKEDGLLNNKRGREGEVRFKRVIKKKKEFDDNKTNEKNDIFEDIKKIIHLNENNK